ncbi:hypothetical protein [Hyphomonas sp.]|uniref:hypothetical protein n=1 Tax=Hyphomonas sp. TaxID=87 RepID=UPI003002C338
MRALVDLIERHAKSDSEFHYYITIIEKAEENEQSHPDITIECCTALFQGISKSIVHRLDPECDIPTLDRETLPKQVRYAFNCLKQNDDVVEDEYARAAENLARIAGSLRNVRGDISHGRAVPKELESDRSLSRLVLTTSEAVLRYMLASYFSIRPEPEQLVEYQENPAFNDELDELNPLEGKPLYSRALYEQYYEDYLVQLDDFMDRMDSELSD